MLCRVVVADEAQPQNVLADVALKLNSGGAHGTLPIALGNANRMKGQSGCCRCSSQSSLSYQSVAAILLSEHLCSVEYWYYDVLQSFTPLHRHCYGHCAHC